MHRRLLLAGLAVVLSVALVAAATGRVPIADWMAAVVAYIRGAGATGVAVFALAYVLSAVFLVPGSILTLGAGFAFGPFVGVLIASPVSVLAAAAAFATGRFLARDWVGRRLAGDRRFAAIDEAIGAQGLRIVLLLRLSPLLPFNLLNYALGLTKVSFRDYVIGSWIGMLPVTALLVYLGSLVSSLGDLQSGGATEGGGVRQVLYWLGLAATVVVVVVVTRVARRALDAALAPHGGAPHGGDPSVHGEPRG